MGEFRVLPRTTTIDRIFRICEEGRRGKEWKQTNTLIKRAQDGDNDAQNEVVLMNLGLVLTVSKGYKREDLPLEDVVGYGVEGLIRAIEKFRSKKGTQFSTFATLCIKHTIQRRIQDTERLIRIPGYKVTEMVKARAVATSNGVKKENFFPFMIPLDKRSKGKDEEGDELVDSFSSGTPSPEEETMNLQRIKSAKEMVALLKSCLPATQWFVLEKRFGFNDREEETTLEDIGRELSLTRERVRQIESIALKKARKILKDFS